MPPAACAPGFARRPAVSLIICPFMRRATSPRDVPLLLVVLAFSVSACGGSSEPAPGEIFYPGYESAIYSNDAHWMCQRSFAADICDTDLDATIVEADGGYEVVPHEPLQDAPADCLYFYPTVRLGSEGNAAFDDKYTQEIRTTRNQAARFGTACEVFAPLYRQRTLTAPAGDFGAIAYADVVDAFKYYLGNLNEGRPFVLIGHSQGAGHIRRLLQDEVDGNPAIRERMISALILGSTVIVPEGEDVGGSFENIPICRSAEQVGCVISYASFRDTVPPASNALFGRSREGGMEAVCTNPANLTGGAGELTPYFDRRDGTQFGAANPDLAWDPALPDKPRLTTPFVGLPGLVSAQCVRDGEFHYLELAENADPGPRTDTIGGDLGADWGMHLVDANVAMGNLVEIVRGQIRAWFN